MPTKPVARRIGGTERSRSAGMSMPHERDESSTDAKDNSQLNPVQADQMEQARRDVESERQDTDCRSVPQPEGSACPQPDPDAGQGDDPTSADRGER